MSSTVPIGMYTPFRFDPTKVALPPILRGAATDRQSNSSAVTLQNLKRKREFGHTGFRGFEQALHRATENELNFAFKRVRLIFDIHFFFILIKCTGSEK